MRAVREHVADRGRVERGDEVQTDGGVAALDSVDRLFQRALDGGHCFIRPPRLRGFYAARLRVRADEIRGARPVASGHGYRARPHKASPPPACGRARCHSRARRRRLRAAVSRRRQRTGGEGGRDPESAHRVPRSRLGAGLPRPLRRGRLLRLHVRTERHAQLPPARPRQERRDRPHQPDLRVRTGDRPRRQQGLAPLGSPHLPEGADPRPAGLRRSPCEGADDPRRASRSGSTAGFPRNEDGTPQMDTTLRGYDAVRPDRLGRGRRPSWRRRSTTSLARTTARMGPQKFLEAQGYEPAMVEAMHGAGVQAIKMRGGMPLLGAGRVFGFYRFANMLALLDAKLRPDAPPEEIVGSRAFDNYAWHTDLPPGHPMVTGQPDGRLRPLRGGELEADRADRDELDLHEDARRPLARRRAPARARGSIVISADYMPTANKADEFMIIRPGTDAALFLGVARELIAGDLYDREAVVQRTDLPLLVRMDTGDLPPARTTSSPATGRPSSTNNIVLKPDEEIASTPPAPPFTVGNADRADRAARGVGRLRRLGSRRPTGRHAVTRDEVGASFSRRTRRSRASSTSRSPTGRASRHARCSTCSVSTWTTRSTSPRRPRSTGLPEEAIVSLARQLAENKRNAFLAAGMGPNHYFNNDLFGRTHFLSPR